MCVGIWRRARTYAHMFTVVQTPAHVQSMPVVFLVGLRVVRSPGHNASGGGAEASLTSLAYPANW